MSAPEELQDAAFPPTRDDTSLHDGPLLSHVPRRIGRYRTVKKLGAGGMGAVYLAEDTELDRRVALKVPFFDSGGGAEIVARFYREARVAAAIDHPNICNVHEVIDEPNGQPCIVMQYLEGQTLSERLRRGPLETNEALSIVSDVAAASGSSGPGR